MLNFISGLTNPKSITLAYIEKLPGRQLLIGALISSLSLLAACHQEANPPETSPQTNIIAPQPNAPKIGHWGLDTNSIDSSIQAGNDFYRYVNKGWLDTVKIPQGKSSIDAFTALKLQTEQQIADLIKTTQNKAAAPGSPEQRIADLYTSYIAIARRDQYGIAMIRDVLDVILSVQTRSELASKLGQVFYNSPIGVATTIDAGNPKRYIPVLFQSGLGLPNRDYYLIKKEPYLSDRVAYASYIEGVLKRAGIQDAAPRAKAIFDFETKLAQGQWPSAQLRDPIKTYKLISKRNLLTYAPGFDWQAFLQASGYAGSDTLQLLADSAIKASAALFAKTPVETLRDYVAFHYLNNHAELLSKEWSDAYFDFFSRRLEGIAEQRPIEERTVEFVNNVLGEEIGKLYVARHFPAESKAKTETMVGYILAAMQDHLQQLDWMDKSTRKEALAKLAAFSVEVGYPSQWHDFSSVRIAPEDLVGNMHRLLNWKRTDELAKLKEPVRRWEWDYNPQQINAFYAPDLNKIAFLAALLQAPFFDPNADPAVNFGAIGMVIGHEIGHAFDDQGRYHDGSGKLRNWWSKASGKKFKAKTDRLVARYNKFSPVNGVHLNGQLTLGENIGDLCGLSVAYTAYQKYAAAKYPNGSAPVIDGYTGNQRFFLGFAQLWRSVATDARARQLALIDVHSPGEFRVNGIVPNFDAWYEAFGVTKEHSLFLPKQERINIW